MKRTLYLWISLSIATHAAAQSTVNSLTVQQHTVSLSNAPFVKISNRGLNTGYSNVHVLGGVLAEAYRDVWNPATVAGIWFERKPIVNGLSSDGEIVFGTSLNSLQTDLPDERMRINAGGNVGIGTSEPAARLHVNGKTISNIFNAIEGAINLGYLGRGQTITGGWSATPDIFALTYMQRDFAIGGWGKSDGLWKGASLYINSDNGNVLLGKTTQTNTSYRLDVNGNVRANKVVVNTTGADFVFEPGYLLPSLREVEKFIRERRHLPGIAPARDMVQQGLDVGDQQTRLLQKVEELTLYIIELNKKIETQQQQLDRQGKALHMMQEN